MPKNYSIKTAQDCEGVTPDERIVVTFQRQSNSGNLAVFSGSIFSSCQEPDNEIDHTFTYTVDGVTAYQGPGVTDETVTIPSGTYQGTQFRIEADADDILSPKVTIVSGLTQPMTMQVKLGAIDTCKNEDSKTVPASFSFSAPKAIFTIADNGGNSFTFDGQASKANGCPGGINAYFWEFPDMVEGADYNYTNGTDSNSVTPSIQLTETTNVTEFTIKLTVTTGCGSDTAQATSTAEGGGTDCDEVNYPLPSQMATTPEAELNGNVVHFTWTNLVEQGNLPAPVVSVSNITPNSAQVNWNAVTGATSYSIRYREVGQTSWLQIDNITGTNQAISGLVPDTDYEVQGQTKFSGGQNSVWGNTASFKTSQQTTSTDGIQIGFDGFLNTPKQVYSTEDSTVAAGVVRIYANYINITQGSSNGSDPAFNPSDGFSGQNQDAYLESLAAAGHGIIYVPEGAPWYTPDYAVSKRDGFVLHALPADNPGSIYSNGNALIDRGNYSEIGTNYAIMAARWGDPATAVHGITNPSVGLLANVRGSKGPVNQNIFRNGGGLQFYNEPYEHWEADTFTYTLPPAMASALGLPATESRKGGDIPPEAHAAILHAISEAVSAVNTSIKIYAGSDVFFDPDQFARWKWYWDSQNGGVIPSNIQYAIHHYQHTGGMNNPDYTKLIDFNARPISPDQGGSAYNDMEDLFSTAMGLIQGAGIPAERTGLFEFGYDQDDRPWAGFGNGGPNVVDPIGSMDKIDVASSWGLRMIIHAARTGVREFAYYAVRDAQEGTTGTGNRQGTLFGTSGARFGNYNVHKLWYHLMLMARRIQGKNWTNKVTASDASVKVDRFEKGNQVTYTIYKNTASDSTSNNVTFQLAAGETGATRYVRSNTSDQGVSSTPSVAGSTVTIPLVDEHVQYITVTK